MGKLDGEAFTDDLFAEQIFDAVVKEGLRRIRPRPLEWAAILRALAARAMEEAQRIEAAEKLLTPTEKERT